MERAIAKSLLEIGAVSLKAEPPFTWASGRKSPIYCDNRLLMSHPARRREVARGFASLLEAKGWKPEVVAGTATAGIPHAAWLADLLELPMVYVRGAAKDHGKGNRVEGALTPGQPVVLIEDLISTGGSSVEAAEGLIESGAKLLGVAAIFTYALPNAEARFAKAGVSFAALTSFPTLLEVALAEKYLSAEEQRVIGEWRHDPGAWSLARGGAA